jgi:hypothetical protein
MQIVLQSVPFSYSLSPSVPLLAAPPAPKLLAAPQIAGLLPARVPTSAEIIVEFPLTREELLSQLGPVRSRDEMNAEITGLAREALAFMAGWRDLRDQRYRREARSQGAQPRREVTL